MEEITSLKNLTPNVICDEAKIRIGTEELYFIFVDDKVKGYTGTEQSARNILEQLYNELEAEALKNGKEKCKVYRQNVSGSEIKISQQILGRVFDGAVVALHNIHYEKVFNLLF